MFLPSRISVLLYVQPYLLKSQESSRRMAWLWWCNCWCYHDMIRDWPWCRPCLMHSPASSHQRDRVPVHWSAALTITDFLQQCLCGTNVPRCWSRRTCRDASRQTDLQSYLRKQLMFVKCARYTFSFLRQGAGGHFSFWHDRILLGVKMLSVKQAFDSFSVGQDVGVWMF